jgi:ADP-heptose:LPS heptosyltransferase
VLTTPVVRCLKKQLGAEIHYLCKENFKSIMETNPNVDVVWSFKKDISEVLKQLKSEKFDFILDLHHNLRTFRLKAGLRRPSKSYPKINLEKWLMVNFKWNRLPDTHVVDRYFEVASPLGIENDGKGLDYFLPDDIEQTDNESKIVDFLCVNIGAAHFTKQMPTETAIKICNKSPIPVVLIGGKAEEEKADIIRKAVEGIVMNKCGRLSLHESAYWIKNCQLLITADTGMMHIGAAFKKPMMVLWGNTIQSFGMSSYYGNDENQATHFEVEGLSCRPCSKIGFDACPKGHFKCMNDISPNALISTMNELLNRNS